MYLLPMRYCGGIGWWLKAFEAGPDGVAVDAAARHNKRDKATHRCDICDTHGVMQLTVPVSVDPCAGRPLRWTDINVSPQAHWWSVHLTALESAYGRTPYFEFYIDRFAPLYTPRYADTAVPLWQLDSEFDARIADCLDLPHPLYITDPADPRLCEPAGDLRRAPLPSPLLPYWQVRAGSFGFVGALSVLDLIFNLGPEAQLYLYRAAKALKS